MIVAADTHVHLYPEYDLALAFRSGTSNLARLAERAAPDEPKACALFLTERRDCHVFRSLLSGGGALPGVEVSHSAAADAIEVRSEAGSVRLFPGRQIVTSERLEVLCLTVDAEIPDGLALEDALARVRAKGGVAVVPFAPGKWLGRRGLLLRRVLAGESGRGVLVSDSALRSRGWLRPTVLAEAGRRLLAGSDPLPLPGEERRVGNYATLWRTELDWRDPAATARALLGAPPLALAGHRLYPWALATRLRRLGQGFRRRSKTTRSAP